MRVRAPAHSVPRALFTGMLNGLPSETPLSVSMLLSEAMRAPYEEMRALSEMCAPLEPQRAHASPQRAHASPQRAHASPESEGMPVPSERCARRRAVPPYLFTGMLNELPSDAHLPVSMLPSEVMRVRAMAQRAALPVHRHAERAAVGRVALLRRRPV